MIPPKFIRLTETTEFYTDEKCYIRELINQPNDPDLSIAVARVEPGVTTVRHKLHGTAERYYILSGTGLMEVDNLRPREVNPGDLVLIPQESTQRITNTGDSDLIFLCICTPGFRGENYLTA
jgi:mannose-6-phosphate isomerase-like protein (cupin superfamily)